MHVFLGGIIRDKLESKRDGRSPTFNLSAPPAKVRLLDFDGNAQELKGNIYAGKPVHDIKSYRF